MSAASYLKAKYWGADYPMPTETRSRRRCGMIGCGRTFYVVPGTWAILCPDCAKPAPEPAPLTPEEEAEEARKEAEQQALVDRNRPEEYDHWTSREGWVGNAEEG